VLQLALYTDDSIRRFDSNEKNDSQVPNNFAMQAEMRVLFICKAVLPTLVHQFTVHCSLQCTRLLLPTADVLFVAALVVCLFIAPHELATSTKPRRYCL